VASFHNSSGQFLRLRGILILVSSKLSDSRIKILVYFSLFETVLQQCLTFLLFHRYVDLVVDCLKTLLLCTKFSQK